MMGSFRIGVSQTLVVRALAEATKMEPSIMAHRLMGKWLPTETSYEALILHENKNDDASQPYPFYLAYAIEGGVENLGIPGDWLAEWKWDGIRSQVIFRSGELFIWTRGEDLATDKFPELNMLKSWLPEGTVLDGEIVCYRDNRPLPFNVLQTRIGRKNVSKQILKDAPIGLLVYDLLEINGDDVRNKPQQERRKLLEELFELNPDKNITTLSPLIDFKEWQELIELHKQSREHVAEGFMIKRKSATYQVGRKKVTGGNGRWIH